MASIDKVDAGWRARWRTPDGLSRSKTFVKKVDAERHLTSVQHSKLSGAYVDPSAGRVTFSEYAERWRAVQVHRPSTAARVESDLRLHVVPRIGRRPLSSVTPTDLQGLVKMLSGTLAPGTVALIYKTVVAVFRAAIADRIITVSPCVGVRLPKREERRVVPLSVEAVESVAAAVPDRYRALILLAAGTGLRQGECFGLTVDRLDFLRRQVTVDRQLSWPVGQGAHLAPPKTQASYRTVPLPQVVVDALAVHLAAFPAGHAGFVFTDPDGAPMSKCKFAPMWRRSATAVGLPAGAGFHALRHFYASLLIRHGESVKVVQSRLGHASAAETLDTYSHLWPDSEDCTRDAVDAVLGRPASQASTRSS